MHEPDSTDETGDPRHAADRELVRRSLSSDSAARELIERLRCVPRILAAKNATLGRALDDAELEDLAQVTLIAVWNKRGDYEGRASIESWVYPFCFHQLMNRIRVLRRRPRTTSMEAARQVQESQPPDFGEVHRALDSLEPDEAIVVRLRHFEELNFPQIGERLGISPNTAKSRYHRGVRALRTRLAKALREDER